MATIVRRPSADDGAAYRARTRIRGQPRTATFTRKTDARDQARDVESALKRGRYVPDSDALRRTVGDPVDW